ncbi:MAG: hypothetical protein IKS02_04970 [Fibrobacter sp.]|nr:hypothetical protein [Fibrobacter sp.]
MKKYLIWASAALTAMVCMTACGESSGNADISIPEYVSEAGLPDSCDMQVAKVYEDFYACYQNKWIEVTDSAIIEKIKEGIDEDELKETLEDLIAKLSSSSAKPASSSSEDDDSEDSEENVDSDDDESTDGDDDSTDDDDDSTDGDDGSDTSEGGSSASEEGSSASEGGSSASEGGSSASEGGSSASEGGSSASEGGSSASEGGSSASEGGSSASEEGSSNSEEPESSSEEVSSSSEEPESSSEGESSSSEEPESSESGSSDSGFGDSSSSGSLEQACLETYDPATHYCKDGVVKAWAISVEKTSPYGIFVPSDSSTAVLSVEDAESCEFSYTNNLAVDVVYTSGSCTFTVVKNKLAVTRRPPLNFKVNLTSVTYKGSTVSLNLSESVLAYDSLFGRSPTYSFLDSSVVWYSYSESALLGNVTEGASEEECIALVRQVPQSDSTSTGLVIFTCNLNSVSEYTCSAQVGSGRTGTTYTLKFVEGKRECRITASVKTNSGGLSF